MIQVHVHNLEIYKDLEKNLAKVWTNPKTLIWIAKELKFLWLFKEINNIVQAIFF